MVTLVCVSIKRRCSSHHHHTQLTHTHTQTTVSHARNVHAPPTPLQYLIQFFYPTDQVRVTGRVLKEHVICNRYNNNSKNITSCKQFDNVAS